MRKFKRILLVLSIQEKAKNKTVRYIERHRVGDYRVLLPSGLDERIIESYGEHAEVYDLEALKKDVDFMGTNIKNGCAVGRLAANRYIREHPEFDFGVVLDDDYAGLVSDFTPKPTMAGNTLGDVLDAVYKLGEELGFELGGYSGGAHPRREDRGDWLVSIPKNNIMNVFIIDKNTRDRGFDKILDEDVCHSIYNWHRGVATFGLEDVIRSGAQTAEMTKSTGIRSIFTRLTGAIEKASGLCWLTQKMPNWGLTIIIRKEGRCGTIKSGGWTSCQK